MSDECFLLMQDLASAIYSYVHAGKINEGDIINFDGNRVEIGELLDKADAMIARIKGLQ